MFKKTVMGMMVVSVGMLSTTVSALPNVDDAYRLGAAMAGYDNARSGGYYNNSWYGTQGNSANSVNINSNTSAGNVKAVTKDNAVTDLEIGTTTGNRAANQLRVNNNTAVKDVTVTAKDNSINSSQIGKVSGNRGNNVRVNSTTNVKGYKSHTRDNAVSRVVIGGTR